MSQIKALLRKNAPQLYDSIIRLQGSRSARLIDGWRNRHHLHKLIRSNHPFRIDICGKMGFGATLTRAIVLHHFLAERPGFKGILASNPLYAEASASTDMIGMFFDRLDAEPDSTCAILPYRHTFDISSGPLEDQLTIRRAHELFLQHYAVKERFLEEARDLFSANFRDAIGVHFRGSDKRLEARRIDFDAFAQAVDACIASTGVDRIFIATDEAEFLAFMQQRYGSQRAQALDCKYLSDGVRGSHYLGGDGFEKGREALLTILLLSMCRLCIRGASHLSAWAKILNPQLPILMLGEPFPALGFPEDEILKTSVESLGVTVP